MDFGSVPIIVIIVGLILLQFFLMRRRKVERTRPEVVQSLLSEVKLNQALVETFNLRQKLKKFEIVSWQRNKTKLDFLDQALQVAITDAFTTAEDFNQQIEVAKKYKSTSYTASINIDKLKEPLAKSQQGLEQWLLSNIGRKEPPPKYPGILDDWLGRR